MRRTSGSQTMWAQLGTDDEAGRRIRDIAFDNLHELTMDESAQEQLDPSGVLAARRDRRPDARRCPPTTIRPRWTRSRRRSLERIPNARLVRIPDTDHVINLRRPEEFDRVVLEFLAEVL